MAKIGLRYLVGAEIDTEPLGDAPTYKEGFKIGKMISADLSVDIADNPLYADDGIAETDKSFTGGSLTLGIDDFGNTPEEGKIIQHKVLGQKIVEVNGVNVLRSCGQTTPPNLGVGFISVKKLRDKMYYTATWLYKVQFGAPSETAATKGDSIEWQTPEIEGTIMVVEGFDDDTYRDTVTFSTLGEAMSWVNNMANINDVVDKQDLIEKINDAESEDAETYTSQSYADMFVALLNAQAVNSNKYATQQQVDSAKTALDNAILALEVRN